MSEQRTIIFLLEDTIHIAMCIICKYVRHSLIDKSNIVVFFDYFSFLKTWNIIYIDLYKIARYNFELTWF